MPRVSVLMCVYDCEERWLTEAVESILGQTFHDFEFIIVDDGSTDSTPAILDRYSDPRIVRLRNETNLGLTRSLNRGLRVARGELVARQDADDVSLPQRLMRQVAFLDTHPRCCMVGGDCIWIDADGRELKRWTTAHDNVSLQARLFLSNPFAHGSVMFRRSSASLVGNYDEAYRLAQDRQLWLRLAECCDIANLAEPLYKVRMYDQMLSVRCRPDQQQASVRAIAEAIARRRRAFQVSAPWSQGRFHFQSDTHTWHVSRADARGKLIAWAVGCADGSHYASAARFAFLAVLLGPLVPDTWSRILIYLARRLVLSTKRAIWKLRVRFPS